MLAGNTCYRVPGQDWDYCPETIDTAAEVLHDLWLELINDDESEVLGCDVAIRTADGVFHIIATATDTPTELGAHPLAA